MVSEKRLGKPSKILSIIVPKTEKACSFVRTPLHCAASCNNVQVCKFLVESGAAVYATTYSDMQTAADKCEEMEEGYAQCSQFLYGKKPVLLLRKANSCSSTGTTINLYR